MNSQGACAGTLSRLHLHNADPRVFTDAESKIEAEGLSSGDSEDPCTISLQPIDSSRSFTHEQNGGPTDKRFHLSDENVNIGPICISRDYLH